MMGGIIAGAVRALDDYRALRAEVAHLRQHMAEVAALLKAAERRADAGSRLADEVRRYLDTDELPLSGLRTRLLAYRDEVDS